MLYTLFIKYIIIFKNNVISRSINFGAIGMIIAHEMMHALDNAGRTLTKKGISKQLWSEESRKQYQIKSDKIRRQFSEYWMWGQVVSNVHIHTYRLLYLVYLMYISRVLHIFNIT